ncbi:MAG: MFS transporter, partial [Solirubrobacteraceae bacterium]
MAPEAFVIGSDDSTAAMETARLAAELAASRGSRLHLVTGDDARRGSAARTGAPVDQTFAVPFGRRSDHGPGASLYIGTDGGSSAREDVMHLADFAASHHAPLHIVGVYEDRDDQQRTIRVTLEDAARNVRRDGLEVWLHAVRATPDGERSAAGEREHACLALATEEHAAEPPTRSERPRLSREWKVLLISTLAVFMALLDVTIVNIAFPAIHHAFPGTSLSDLSWVINAYNVVIAALLVPAGRVADRLGRRRLFFIGLAVFLAGSALAGAAPTPDVLIAARVLQAVGAAILIPASYGIVLAEFPIERRATATAVWAAAGAVAAAAGPSLGGVIVQTVSWRAVFLVNLVVALGMLPARRLFRESRDPEAEGSPDFVGGLLLAGSVGVIALGIVKAPDWGWTSVRVLGCVAVSGLLTATLMQRSRRHPSPVLEPALLRIRMFRLANASTFVFSVGFYALLLSNILFLSEVWRYSILTAGFAVSPGPLCAAVAAGLSGRVVHRFGPRAVALPGLLLFALACLLYRGVGATPDYLGSWLPAQIVSGTAIGLAFAG